MCQFCRLGQRFSQSGYSQASLLDTSQFSTLVVTDHRRESAQVPLTHEQSLPGEQNHDRTIMQPANS